VLAFSDGMFAIAVTLLVVGITVPTLTDGDNERQMLEALNDLVAEIISFFISFTALLGSYFENPISVAT
jgi:uncharacterized membrane protein